MEKSPILENISDFLKREGILSEDFGVVADYGAPEIPATQTPPVSVAFEAPVEEPAPENIEDEEPENGDIEINEPVPANLEQQVKDFIRNNPNLDDARMHKFADLIGVNKHEVEEMTYKLLSQYLNEPEPPVEEEPEYEEPEDTYEEEPEEYNSEEEPSYEDEWNESTDESLVIEAVGVEKFKKLSPQQKLMLRNKELKKKEQLKQKAQKVKAAAKAKADKLKAKTKVKESVDEDVNEDAYSTGVKIGKNVAAGALLWLIAAGSVGLYLKLKQMKRQNKLLKVKLDKEKDDTAREKIKTQLSLQDAKIEQIENEIKKKKLKGKMDYEKMTPEEQAAAKQKAEDFASKFEKDYKKD